MTPWRIYPDPPPDLEARWLDPEHCPPWRRPHLSWNDRTDGVPPVDRPFNADDEGAHRDQERAKHYVSSGAAEDDRVNLALLLRRPLLVRGPPGIGKSSLAYRVAQRLGLGRPFRWEIQSTTTLADGLYQYDAVAHFHQGKDAPIQEHLRLGPLGTTLCPTQRPACLLVDELDKASYDLPNDLLHAFEEGAFRIPELQRVEEARVQTLDGRAVTVRRGEIRCHHHPVVLITSNDEREFPPAFLRRCVELKLDLPDEQQIRSIASKWFGGAQGLDAVLARVGSAPTDRLLQALYLSQVHGVPLAACSP
ncbi:MoxR family ATPase [Myxococcota bacterium]|nr:MoxR family ATPase [Myxococcota bacterium]